MRDAREHNTRRELLLRALERRCESATTPEVRSSSSSHERGSRRHAGFPRRSDRLCFGSALMNGMGQVEEGIVLFRLFERPR